MAAAAEVVDLVSSDDEENRSPNVKRQAAAWSETKARIKREGSHEVICLDFSDDSDGHDDDVAAGRAAACLGPNLSTVAQPQNEEEELAVVAPPPVQAPTADRFFKSDKSGVHDADEDVDVAIVGATGPNALADFPHSRENCVVHPHAQDAARHCPNCYCYVCDVLTSKCPAWQAHCHASHKEAKWRKMRQDVRMNGGVVITLPVPAFSRRIVTTTTVRNPTLPPPVNVTGRPDMTSILFVPCFKR